jgi:exodeoxyribonuclease VII small subunit
MSKTAKGPSGGEETDLSFSQALEKLQNVVEAMESDDLPLETLLARYEEGMKLARKCEARLAAAEVRIQQLEQDAAGALATKPFTTDDTKAE